MLSSKGVIQGYDGLAMVDAKHQIVVHAEAFGEGQEHGLLVPMLEGTRQTFRELELSNDVLKNRIVTADAGFCSEANSRYLLESGIDAYVADPQFRRRDIRFAEAARHRPRRDSEPFAKPKKFQRFLPRDFQPSKDFSHCIYPAGKRLHRNGARVRMGDLWAVKFSGSNQSCQRCALRRQCLRYPERTPVRQVTIARGRLADRQRARSISLRPSARHCRTGIRQHPQHPQAQSPEPARPQEGKCAVAAVLSGAQYRQAAALRAFQQAARSDGTENHSMNDLTAHYSSLMQARDAHLTAAAPLIPDLLRASRSGVFLQAR
jgi:hypothetical protein